MAESKEHLMSMLDLEYCDCQRCPLGKTRKKFVFGNGSYRAKLMLVGEAPGRAEDNGGLPFIGAAGKQLDELLELAGISRADIYIANVLKCRPPANRDPLPAEVEQCGVILKRQILAIDPKVIMPMGNFATRFILNNSTVAISKVRGKVCSTKMGRIVLPTYHPAAIIYDNSKLKDVQEDFLTLKDLLLNV